jgi:ATP-dependent protease ClpP protease subunit
MSAYKIQARGPRAELRIYGDIGQNWEAEESNDARGVVEALDDMTGDLDVRINSFGGSVADGIAIYNAISRYKGRVTTHIDGVAYSIASLIAMAGDQINMAENAMLMIHAPWGFAMGNAPEMREMADVLDKHAEAMLVSYIRAGGPEEDTLRSWLTDGKDHYFTAAEAVEIGLVDRVTDAEPMLGIAAALRDSRFSVPTAAVAAHSKPEATMANPETPAANVTAETDEIVAKHSRTIKSATQAGVKAEAARRRSISDVFSEFYDADPMNPITALHDQCMDDVNCDELGARRKLMAYLANKTADPIVAREHYATEPQPSAPPRASRYLGGAMLQGRDQIEKRSEGLSKALQIKAGLITDRAAVDAERKGEFLALSLSDIMAQEMRAAGHTVGGTREDIARAYLRVQPVLAAGPSHGSDHLPAVLGNIANLSAMSGWEQSEETWNQWTAQGTLSNYQTHTRANVALLDKLTRMLENQEWAYGDMADVKQRITGYFYGLRYSLSIQAIVNDDLGELARTMQGWGEAASATVGDVVYALLTTAGTGGLGQVMDEDSKVLFHADHGNYIASGSGAAPGETTLNTARTAMVAQNDPNGRKVAVRPRFILHGPKLYSTVYKLLNSQAMITGENATAPESNSVPSMNLTPVEEYRMTGDAWILAASRRTVEVAGVGGPLSPRAEQSPVSNVPGLTYELSMPFGAAALDYRGLYYNHGA